MAKIRMVVFDVDGTVFPIGSGRCSEKTREALSACREAGIITAPCSGRSIFMFPEQLSEVINTKYVIYCNGAYIADPKTGEIADSHTVDPHKVADLFRQFSGDDIYHKASTFTRFLDDNPRRKETRSIPTIFVDDVIKILENLDEPLFKAEFFFHEDSDSKPGVLKKLKDCPDFTFSSALKDNIEVNNPEATKGNAVRKLASLYGLSLDEVMAIGDGDNDSSMLEAAGFAVAMGNSPDSLKKIADAVTDTVENDGFAQAIYKYALQKE